MSDEDRAADIVADFLERRERGERIDTGEVLRRHPDLAVPLRQAFAAAQRLEEETEPERPPPSRVGRTIGPFRLDAELGSGGMGTVYLATLGAPAAGKDAGARVAVKLLHPHLLVRPDSVRRLRREAEIGQRVRHDNVVRTLGAAQAADGDERLHLVVMEYVEGRTLRVLLDELGRVPEELCRHVGRETAKALVAIHAAGAVHRDLKPDNLIVTPEQVVKVMDLGVARLEDESLRVSQTGAFVGSVRYAAPEQFGFRRATGAEEAIPRSPVRAKGDPVDGRADLYALGLTLYELATGSNPFAGDDFHSVLKRQLTETPRPAGELNPQLSPFFEELVARLVEKDRDARIASAAELVEILENGEESAWWRERRLAIRAATRRPLRRIRVPRETALYGREAELTLLRSLFERAKEGEGQVALIEGEAGIGKSRLVDEFVGQLAQAGQDVNFLFGSYPPGGAATASGAFSVAYREHFGDDETAIRAALPQTPLLVPAFTALLRGDATPEGAEPLTKDSLQSVFVHATRHLAEQRPTIVLIDDLHFAPDEGRALFAALALAAPGHRVLLVGCARPGLDEKWTAQLAARPQTSRLALPRLGPKELVHLLRDALSSERLAEELGVLIAVKSDGNPFFVFELLRGLRDGQFLRQRPDGTWETTQVIRDIQVPSSIAELVQARVADLDAADKNLLDAAACCSFEFDPLVVGAALGRGRIAVLQSLGRIEKRHRLVRAAGRRFVFDHHQVQEALYAGLSELLREEYHALLGDAVEAQSGAAAKEPKDVAGAVCVEIAEHFLKGAKGERALRYLDAALTSLEAGYLLESAVGLANRALDFPGLLIGRSRCNLLLRKVHFLDLLGRVPEEQHPLEEAQALADRDDDAVLRANVLLHLGRLFTKTAQYEAAESVLRSARDLAVGTSPMIVASSTGVLGIVMRGRGDLDSARTLYEEALGLAREACARSIEAGVTVNLGILLCDLGDVSAARAQFERGAAIARATGNRVFEINATANLGTACFYAGEFSRALELFERAQAMTRQIGNRGQASELEGQCGDALRSLGRTVEALARLERCVVRSHESGLEEEIVARLHLAQLQLDLGAVETARSLLDEAAEVSRRTQVPLLESAVLLRLGRVARESGDQASAERLTRDCLAHRRPVRQRSNLGLALEALGELLTDRDASDEARVALTEANDIARRDQLPGLIVLTTCRLAVLPGGDSAPALLAFSTHRERLDVWESMSVRFLLWRATGDRAHLVEGTRVLDDLVRHAPPQYRESMLANVRLHREIVSAAREHGVAPAADAS